MTMSLEFNPLGLNTIDKFLDFIVIFRKVLSKIPMKILESVNVQFITTYLTEPFISMNQESKTLEFNKEYSLRDKRFQNN